MSVISNTNCMIQEGPIFGGSSNCYIKNSSGHLQFEFPYNIYNYFTEYSKERYQIVISEFLESYKYGNNDYNLKIFQPKSTTIYKSNNGDYVVDNNDKIGAILVVPSSYFDNYLRIKNGVVTSSFTNLLELQLDISPTKSTLTENYYSDSYEIFMNYNNNAINGAFGYRIFVS